MPRDLTNRGTFFQTDGWFIASQGAPPPPPPVPWLRTRVSFGFLCIARLGSELTSHGASAMSLLRLGHDSPQFTEANVEAQHLYTFAALASGFTN